MTGSVLQAILRQPVDDEFHYIPEERLDCIMNTSDHEFDSPGWMHNAQDGNISKTGRPKARRFI